MSTELENTLARELHEVADGVHVPPMPALPPPDEHRSLTTRLWAPLLVAAAVVLLVGGLALVLGRPGDTRRAERAPAQRRADERASGTGDGTISGEAPTVPYVVDQRLYVDGDAGAGHLVVGGVPQGELAGAADRRLLVERGPGPGHRPDRRRDGPASGDVAERPLRRADRPEQRAVPRSPASTPVPAGEGFGVGADRAAHAPRVACAIRVRAVTDDGDVIVQGRRISLMWLAQQGDQQTVVDLFETAPDQQVLGRHGGRAGRRGRGRRRPPDRPGLPRRPLR